MSKPIEGRDHSEFEHGEEIRQEKPFRAQHPGPLGRLRPRQDRLYAEHSRLGDPGNRGVVGASRGRRLVRDQSGSAVGTPFVHMKMDFRSPVTPRHMLDCDVRLKRLGTSLDHARGQGVSERHSVLRGRVRRGFRGRRTRQFAHAARRYSRRDQKERIGGLTPAPLHCFANRWRYPGALRIWPAFGQDPGQTLKRFLG